MAEGKKHRLSFKQLRLLFARGILRGRGTGKNRKVAYNKNAGSAERQGRVEAGKKKFGEFIKRGATPRAIAAMESRGWNRKDKNLLNAVDAARAAKPDHSATRAARVAAGKQRLSEFAQTKQGKAWDRVYEATKNLAKQSGPKGRGVYAKAQDRFERALAATGIPRRKAVAAYNAGARAYWRRQKAQQ